MIKYTVTSETETMALGALLAADAFPNAVVLLEGDLGAGKTTFTKGIAQGLGITKVIKSPTYTLIREYTQGDLPLFHMDMYRIEETGGASELGLEEYFQRGGLSVIEWAKFVAEELPEGLLVVQFEQDSLTQRTITIQATGAPYEQWLLSLERRLSKDA